MRKSFKAMAAVAVALPLMGQSAGPIPPALNAELQGVWVSRYETDPSRIEVRGDEIFVLTPMKGSNPTPVGRAFKMVRIDETRPDASTGTTNYMIGGECLGFGGSDWRWFTDSPGCQVGVTTSGFGTDAKGKIRRGRALHAFANTYVRPPHKDGANR